MMLHDGPQAHTRFQSCCEASPYGHFLHGQASNSLVSAISMQLVTVASCEPPPVLTTGTSSCVAIAQCSKSQSSLMAWPLTKQPAPGALQQSRPLSHMHHAATQPNSQRLLVGRGAAPWSKWCYPLVLGVQQQIRHPKQPRSLSSVSDPCHDMQQCYSVRSGWASCMHVNIVHRMHANSKGPWR